MGFPDNRKLWISKLSSKLRLTVTCHMWSYEQWGKISVGIAGLKNPIADTLGRGGKKSGGVKMHRVWGCAPYDEILHAVGEERRCRRKQWEERTDPGKWRLSRHPRPLVTNYLCVSRRLPFSQEGYVWCCKSNNRRGLNKTALILEEQLSVLLQEPIR